MSKKEKPVHVLITTPNGKLSMECTNCHTCEIQFMPSDQEAVKGFVEYFTKKHSGCKLGKSK